MSKKRRIERYTVKTQNPNKAPFEPAPYTYLALDSCILIDFLKLIDPNSKVNKKSPYYIALRDLLSKSVFRKDGTINIDGKYIFCVLPTVMEEISNPNHQLHNVMKNFVQNRTIALELDQFKEKQFEKLVAKLAFAYAERGIFCDSEGNPTYDAFIVAQASIFNMMVISNDHHIVRNQSPKKSSSPHREIIRRINQRVLGGLYSECQALPKSAEQLMHADARKERMVEAYFGDFLTIATETKIHKLEKALIGKPPFVKESTDKGGKK